jgi:hypothetical protein
VDGAEGKNGERLPAFVAAMQEPRWWPQPVATVETIQTHASYVLLAGEYAYKFKKAVDYGILDYRSLERRRHFCWEELRLNRRFAPELYLEVLAVVGDGGRYRFATSDDPAALEYCVKMRRFPAEAMMAVQLAAGRVGLAEVEEFARFLVRFHREAAVRQSSGDTVRRVIEGTFASARGHAAVLGREEAFADIRRFLDRQFSLLQPVMAARAEGGRVRECHGDLHMGNLVLLDGRLVPFDGIEFNPDLRDTDVMAELAFLTMDLAAHGREDLANRLVNLYLEESGDWEGAVLLPLMTCYRALVRGWVQAQTVASPGLDAAQRCSGLERSRRYIDLAHRTSCPPRPRLWLTHGLSGSGKSTVARRVAAEAGAMHLRSDAVRKHLAGVALDDHAAPASLYSAEMGERTYARLAALAETLLAAGLRVVLDARYPHRVQRRAILDLAKRLDVPVTILDCRAPLAVLTERLARRSGDASDATPQLLSSQVHDDEPFAPDELPLVQVFDTAGIAIPDPIVD